MPEVSLTISGPTGTKEVVLDPAGTRLGRDPMNDVILNHESVSRRHARIYRAVDESWIIEDLDSRNGIFLKGRRMKTQEMVPGLKISLACFTLALGGESAGSGEDGQDRQSFSVVDRGSQEEVISYRADPATILGPLLLPTFNAFTENLLKMSNSADLYAQACDQLAESIQTFVAIVRLSLDGETFTGEPEVLAHQVPRGDGNRPGASAPVRFSHRVLESACLTPTPVMAKSHPASTQDLKLTFAGEMPPHNVYAARVNKTADSVDLLYVDLPEENVPESMFDFIEAISRQINFVQKNLFFRELQEKEQALRQANRELEEKDRIKDEYVSRVTHDIKGHLGVIKSCLAIAANDSGIGSPEKKAELVERASRRTTQVLSFIADLLRLTRLRLSGRMEVASFSLKEAIAKSLDTVRPRATDKNITLEADVDPDIDTMTGDELSLTEAITNLLFNAIKYTPEHEKVALRGVVRNDQIVITIRDTGIGIPTDEVDQVFDEFFRASNATAYDKDGTGLGLALVKQIVERHGGSVTAENNSDKGATFSVRLQMDGISLGGTK
ncbi:MAG: ATP-binding protein [Candidatus Krumholzibacteriota bacterium]